MIQFRANSPQVKPNFISSIKNLILPHELKLKTGNWKISQVWFEIQPSARSPFQRLNLKQMPTLREKCPIRSYFWSVFSRIRTKYGPEITPCLDTFHAVQSFLVQFSFTEFPYSVPNILPRILEVKMSILTIVVHQLLLLSCYCCFIYIIARITLNVNNLKK